MSHICKNCGNVFEGNYCGNCGQAAATQGIDASFIVHDLQHGLIHVDGGILYSARELFTRPGHAIRDYIEGKRRKHYKPVSMLIVLAGFYGLFYHALHINVFEGRDDSLVDYDKTNEWIAHHFSIITLLLLPVLSFGSYVVFRKQGYNFTEHLIINAFYSAQKLWVRILALPLLLWPGKAQTVMQCLMAVDFVLMFWSYGQFFKNLSLLKTLVLTLLVTFLDLLIIFVLTTIILYFLIAK